MRYSQRLAEHDIIASVGTVGDSYDNAMAEAFNSLYKAELIYHQHSVWADSTAVEYATMEYIDWYNHRRLHHGITADNTYTTPAAHEAAYYTHNNPAQQRVTQ